MSFNNITLPELRKRRARLSQFSATRKTRSARAKGYKVVTISLYSQQAAAVERAKGILRHAGYANVCRSFVVQTLIERCLENQTPERVVSFFEERKMNLPKPRTQARR